MPSLNLSPSGSKWLVFSNGVLGHSIIVLSALEQIKKLYPQARITMVVDRTSAELLRVHPLVDQIDIFDKKQDSFRRQMQLVQQWRKQKYDISLHFRSGVRNELLAFLSGVPFRAGQKLKGSFQFINHICDDIDGVHVLKKRGHFLSRALGHAIHLDPPVLFPDHEAAQRVEAELASHGLEVGKYVVLHPAGKTSNGLQWSLQLWAKAVAKISKKYPVVVVCAPFERQTVQAAIYGENIIHLGADAAYLSEIIARCGWFLGNDSAPAHIAGCWHKPRIVVYPNNTKAQIKWGPFYPETCHIVDRADFESKGLDDALDWLFAQKM